MKILITREKRIIDILITLPINIILLPVYAVIGLMVYFDLGRPVIFKQRRTGKNGKPFDLIKFRSMTNERNIDGQLLPETKRITKLGKIIRKYSLDELISIWLILKGDMSIIGPRPLPVTFDERYSDRHKKRSAVKPGLEGQKGGLVCRDRVSLRRFYVHWRKYFDSGDSQLCLRRKKRMLRKYGSTAF